MNKMTSRLMIPINGSKWDLIWQKWLGALSKDLLDQDQTPPNHPTQLCVSALLHLILRAVLNATKKSAPVRQIGRSDPLSNEWSSNYWWDTKFATKKENRTVGPVLFTLHVSHNPNFLLVSLRKEVRRQKSRVNIVLALNKLIVQSPTKKTDNES